MDIFGKISILFKFEYFNKVYLKKYTELDFLLKILSKI